MPMRPLLAAALLLCLLPAPLSTGTPGYGCEQLVLYPKYDGDLVGAETNPQSVGCLAGVDASAASLMAPGASGLRLIWSHDVQGVTGLTAVFEGPGMPTDPVPLHAYDYREVGTLVPHVWYETDILPIPLGYSGEVTATLLQDGAEIGVAHVRTAL